MNGKVRKSIAALGVTSLLVAGIASAQEATETPDSTTPDTSAEVTPETRAGRNEQRGFLRDLVLEYTGLETEALRTALADGSTLAELIEANGMSVDDFTAAVLAEYDAQAAEARTSFTENLTAVLNGEGSLRFGGFGGRGDGFGGGPRDGGGRGNGGGPRDGRPGADQPLPEVTEEAPAAGSTT